MNHATLSQHSGVTLLADRPLAYTIRPAAESDHRYFAASFRESYKESSSSLARAPWPLYKATVGKEIAGIIDAATMLGAYADDGRVMGWIAYTPGRSISTVHWAMTRHKLDAELLRRRGVLTALWDAADLGKRVAYTHRGGMRHVTHRGGSSRGPDDTRKSVRGATLDVALVEWLKGRGVAATYVPYREWAR